MGTWPGTYLALSIILSYLFLFVKFYIDNYNPAKTAKAVKKEA